MNNKKYFLNIDNDNTFYIMYGDPIKQSEYDGVLARGDLYQFHELLNDVKLIKKDAEFIFFNEFKDIQSLKDFLGEYYDSRKRVAFRNVSDFVSIYENDFEFNSREVKNKLYHISHKVEIPYNKIVYNNLLKDIYIDSFDSTYHDDFYLNFGYANIFVFDNYKNQVNKIHMNNYDLITLLDFYNFLKFDLKAVD